MCHGRVSIASLKNGTILRVIPNLLSLVKPCVSNHSDELPLPRIRQLRGIIPSIVDLGSSQMPADELLNALLPRYI